MKNKYIAPNITVVDMEIESQILAASLMKVDIVDESQGEYSGAFNSSNHIFVFDDEELEQD